MWDLGMEKIDNLPLRHEVKVKPVVLRAVGQSDVPRFGVHRLDPVEFAVGETTSMG